MSGLRAGVEQNPSHGTSAAAAMQARGVVKFLGGRKVLDAVDLAIQRGEFFTLLGPSGCGKTTLLRLIAGLEMVDGGDLHILGRSAHDWPAHERPVNTVFQSYALFPHLTVLDNIRFGPRMKKLPASVVEPRVRSVMELTRIPELGGRKPHELSGGQRQRVALARALVNQPEILLLDEPLAALDLKLRHVLQEELRPLQKKLGTTFIYVTHDQDEAMLLSDRIAVMHEGRILQVGTPGELYNHPGDRFTALFLGGCNVLEVWWKEGCWCTGAGQVPTPVMSRLLRSTPQRIEVESGTLWLGIRPERVICLEDQEAMGGVEERGWIWEGRVLEARLAGASWRCLVQVGSEPIRVVTVNSGLSERREGDRVRLFFPEEALRLLS